MAGPTPAPHLIRQVEVETPEQVAIRLELAGLGSRLLAQLVDLVVLTVWLVAANSALNLLASATGAAAIGAAIKIAVFSVSTAGYFIVLEVLRRGQTIGKSLLGIRVVTDTGHQISWAAAITRNLLRLADMLPPPLYLVGGALVAFHPRAQRLGDLIAGTLVIRDRPQALTAQRSATDGERGPPGAPLLEEPLLSHQEFQLLDRFLGRLPQLEDVVAERVAEQMVARLAPRFPVRSADDMEFLTQLHRSESARRQQGVGSARRSGEERDSSGNRLMARQAGRWQEFHVMATRATREGLDSFGPRELLEFAERYREVAADLARARTYQLGPAVISRLDRLVSAGHGALYRRSHRLWHRLWNIFFRRCPAAVIRSAGYVGLGFAAFAIPGAAGFSMIRQDPGLAEGALPQVMLERAAEGAARSSQGGRYFEAAAGERPAIASYIITNNVRVAAACFAGGALAGVGSLVLLAFNGLTLGATAGHFANTGLLTYLGEFVVGHGFLELFAIWLAGAAGLRLGLAMVAPGRRTRGDALVAEGTVALELLGAATVLLLLAGLIEGFLSAGGQSGSYRLLVSATTVLFLALYLANGFRHRNEPD